MRIIGRRNGRPGGHGVRTTAAGLGGVLLLALLTGCAGEGDGGSEPDAAGDPVVAAKAPARLPVPRGKGSATPDDFNGDGHPDLVLNDLVKGPDDTHGDDAGIGVVYGSVRGLTPGARQLLSPTSQAAPTDGQLPAVFDAEASADLDGDGFTDLVVSTDPPYDGQGMPPVPLQILFGSPSGLTGKAVKLTIPAQARDGNEWPDQPVPGDFDGDGATDLVVHASNGQLSYLRGPFTRKGAPRAAGAPLASPGNVPTGPAADVNGDGRDDLLVRTAEGTAESAIVLGGPEGPTRTGAALPTGIDVALGDFGEGKALDAAVGAMGETALRYDLPTAARGTVATAGSVLHSGDFDGDGLSELVSSGSQLRLLRGRTTGLSTAGMVTVRPPAQGTTRVLTVADFTGDGHADLVVRTYPGETKDTVALYPGGDRTGLVARKPTITFSTSEFLGMDS
ncbi:FG-GAP repeat domain-containing protein [Streptomyces sp. NPDC088747]|uniref:FG-GAP repeat domain-containing protein n=1 Tax=Streptomyces sp. NPDC088747 TaxID=3365886 RepID=UPI00381E53CA